MKLLKASSVVIVATAAMAVGQSLAPDLLPKDIGSSSVTRAPSSQPRNCRFELLRFSPDGRYILAQDASGITVLTAHPFGVLFHRSAENVSHAGFTPDSGQIWFVNTPAHVISSHIAFKGSSTYMERWDIASANRVVNEEVNLRACRSSVLSPGGRTLACVDNFGTLRLLDVDSRAILFEKRRFGSTWRSGGSNDTDSTGINFSSDGRFVVAMPQFAESPALVYDLREQRQVKLAGALKELRRGCSHALLSQDQVMIAVPSAAENVTAKLVELPTGKVLLKVKLPPGRLIRATDPAFVLIRPRDRMQKTSAVELRTGHVLMNAEGAFDVFGDHYVTQRVPDGKLELYERGKGVEATVAVEANKITVQ